MKEKTKAKTALLGCASLAALAAPAAQADSLLFPVLTRSPTVATIVSVANKDSNGTLNVNYFTKSPDLATPCIDGGVRQIASSGRANDLVTFDASGNFLAGQGGGPLFNDPASLAPYGAVDFSAGGTGPARMVLVVDDGDNGGEDLYGEAILLEIAGGAAWGYRAFNPDDDRGQSGFNGPIFANGFVANNDPLGEVLDGDNGTNNAAVTLLPPSEWTTRFFVTPVADGLGGAVSQRDCENCSASIYISPDKAGTTAGLFDRDTIQRSNSFAPAPLPTVAKNVVCTGAVDLADLLPQAILNQVNDQGGWGYVQIRNGQSGNVEDSAVVLKLEFNLVNGAATTTISPDASTTFTGTVNSAVWLRNVDNTSGVSGF